LSNELFVITGPTAVGKGTLISMLKDRHRDIWVSISITTRKPRKFERDGFHYHFVSKKEFAKEIKNNNLLEYAFVHGEFYGTYKSKVFEQIDKNKKVILELDVQGALNVKKILKNKVKTIFVKAPSHARMVEQIKKRATESDSEIEIRLDTAKKELKYIDKFDFVITNDVLDTAYLKLESIIFQMI
jgi:guanylate kinase